MSRIADLVGRGVRVTVGNQAQGEPTEIPADFFEGGRRAPATRFDSPADVPDFAAVYEEAQVPAPFGGYGVDRMAQVLESRRLASLPREVRVAAVMASLEAAGVSLPQVVRDAVLRERALGAFVGAKEREVAALKQRVDTRVATLRREIESFVSEKDGEIDGSGAPATARAAPSRSSSSGNVKRKNACTRCSRTSWVKPTTRSRPGARTRARRARQGRSRTAVPPGQGTDIEKSGR